MASNNAPKGLLSALMKYGGVAEMRAAAPLPKNTQELIDRAVTRVGRQRLTIVEDILAEGLVYNLPNWLSVPSLYFEHVGEAGTAKRTMVPHPRGENQLMDRGGDTIPIYCTWDDFNFGVRELMAAERVGSPLDTTHVEQAVRNVNESHEDSAINGGPTIGGFATPGLLNTTSTFAYVDGEAWTAAPHTGEDILADVLDMVEVAKANKFYGPFNLYIPTTYEGKLQEDFKANSDKTIMSRLQELTFGGRNLRIRTADLLGTDRTLLVQMTSNVVDVVLGQVPTVLSWEVPPGFERNWLVLSCLVPRIKVNAEGKYGIVSGYTS